jgi:hypothetical protein
VIITIIVCFLLNSSQCQAIERIVAADPADPLRSCLYAGAVPALGDGHARFIDGVRCDDGARDMIVGWSQSGLSGFGVVSP